MPKTHYYSIDKDPLRTVDLYREREKGLWVIFIHGGAWSLSRLALLMVGETLSKLPTTAMCS
jgi:acetyl esterase/lipase